MKQRFSSLDVKVIAHELNQHLPTLRVSNIYDLSSKILLFKFAKPDCKRQLIIDSGFRCHLTEFARTTAAAPSVFVTQLRKFLKTRRVTSVVQIGTDRVLEFQFSDGQYRLFLEFFASGNIILTNADLDILTIARNVPEGAGQEPQRVGLKYLLENRQNYQGIPALTTQRVRLALESAVQTATAASDAAEKPKGKSVASLRKSLAVSITELPPIIVHHTLQSNDFDLTAKPEDILQNDALLEKLVRLLSEAREKIQEITSASVCTGYIFAKRKDKQAADSDAPIRREDLLYDDFHPFIPTMMGNDSAIKVLEFSGYNKTVDEFFSSLEGQKLESRLTQREETAKRKLEAARKDQTKRLEGLQEAQSLNFRRAAAIEANVERVQEAMDAINGLLAQGMDWVDIGKLVERERKKKNAVAEIIVLPLNLGENIMTLKLAEAKTEADEEPDPFETDDEGSSDGEEAASAPSKAKQAEKYLTVDINLGISPWSNAREYYDQRRSAAAKEEKTQLQAAKAMKNAEQKINEDLKKGLKQEKALLQPIRQQMWFEKFTWFVSSDGYLVLGGKDTGQNEMLYRKYLRKGDVYCHADLRGAATVIIKNDPKTPEAPIPPATLSQAGSLAVCSSEAWDSKAGMGAWWVNADQVSKSAATGDFLSEGNFTVQGKKNHLAPAQLLLGFGIMFRISDASKDRHVKHRLHDGDAAGADETEQEKPNPLSGGEVDGAAEDVAEQEDDDSLSDVQSEEDESRHESGRDNPLQTQGQGGGDDDDAATDRNEKSELDVANLAIEADAEQEQGADEAGDQGQDRSELAMEAEAASTTTSTWRPSAKAPPKRGQKGKAKKMANKYKDQDEEDRAAAEALIGAAAGKQKAEAEAKARAEAKAQLEAAKERRRAQHQRQQKETAAHEQARRNMMESDSAEATTDLDALVGTPLPGDEVLEAMAVCAPWIALGKFKYKAKMQPGATKKGKAVREVLDRWRADSSKKGAVDEAARDVEKMWPREVELIKGLKTEEVVNVVPVGKVKVMMAGGGGKGKAGGGGGAKGQSKGGRGGKGSKR